MCVLLTLFSAYFSFLLRCKGVGKMLGSALSFLGSNFKFSVALARILRFLAWYSATKSISQVRLELHNITDILPFLIDQVGKNITV